jgi:hypothetical protein
LRKASNMAELLDLNSVSLREILVVDLGSVSFCWHTMLPGEALLVDTFSWTGSGT